MLDRIRVEAVADALGTEPGLIEKDWHVVRAIGVIAAAGHTGAMPVFSGGTSLSKGWGLVKRFSEDIDFKVGLPSGAGKAVRRSYRHRILDALTTNGFTLAGEPRRSNDNRFFSADLTYASEFTMASAFRPHVMIEMTFGAPALPPTSRPIGSLIAAAHRHAPEVAAFPCVDPVETAADKLSALAWRVCTRQRGAPKDDPRIVRHMHDLAALETMVAAAPAFAGLVPAAAVADTGRGGGGAPTDPIARFALMLERLRSDKLWAVEYGEFVRQASFAAQDELVGFAEALEACERLASSVA